MEKFKSPYQFKFREIKAIIERFLTHARSSVDYPSPLALCLCVHKFVSLNTILPLNYKNVSSYLITAQLSQVGNTPMVQPNVLATVHAQTAYVTKATT